MRVGLVISISLFGTVLLAQKSDSVLYGNIYRNYGAELEVNDEVSVSYEMFKDGEKLSIFTYHPKGYEYRQLIDSVSNAIISTYNADRTCCWSGINENGYEYSASDVWVYEKVGDLPYPVYKKIYQEQLHNGRNLFVDFLELDIRSVCTDGVDVFDGINGAKEGCLVRGDLVEVIADQGDWVHIKYLRTDKEYWTHKSCLE